MRKAHEVCEDHNDPATASLIDIWLDQTEKRTWFLFEAARGASDGGH
jgi:starvation-inducible DNA-binding protein